MDWLVEIKGSCLGTLGWLTALAIPFAILVRLTPCNRGLGWWKAPQAACTDLLYWLVIPLFARVCRAILLAGGMVLLFAGGSVGFRLVRAMPLWQQCLCVLLLQDVVLYWLHRGFHTHAAWKFHAVHHSPANLDFLSASRFHLVNVLGSFVLADVVILLLGFTPQTLILLSPFNVVYASMVHANLNWTFGPLRYVLASPVFHRWHHTQPEEGGNRNFASTFPILDVLFGTFYLPADRLPENYGNGEPDFPDDFWGQFIQPFRKQPLQPALSDKREAA
jgi:sterol desaturase/sphingolipid hydroxylase (fatty acid hydroxylase superfamily)